jgi:hypothetical protein
MRRLVHSRRRTVVTLGAIALLVGGCSGSSTDPRDDFVVRPIPSFAATDAVSRQLFAEASSMGPTLRASLPTTGTARYTGDASWVDSNTSPVLQDGVFPEYEAFLVNNPDYVSRVQMTANFAGDTISGSMGSFRNANNEPFRIGITFSGQIVESGSRTAAFTGNLAGTNEIQKAPGEFETKTFTGRMEGNFLGARGEKVLGTLNASKGFRGEQFGDVFGVFTAEQP